MHSGQKNERGKAPRNRGIHGGDTDIGSDDGMPPGNSSGMSAPSSTTSGQDSSLKRRQGNSGALSEPKPKRADEPEQD